MMEHFSGGWKKGREGNCLMFWAIKSIVSFWMNFLLRLRATTLFSFLSFHLFFKLKFTWLFSIIKGTQGTGSGRQSAWRTVDRSLYHCTGGGELKPSPRKKCKKAKWLSGEALQTAEKKRKVKGKGERERYTQLNAVFQRIARRDKRVFLSEQCKDIEGNNRMGKTKSL